MTNTTKHHDEAQAALARAYSRPATVETEGQRLERREREVALACGEIIAADMRALDSAESAK